MYEILWSLLQPSLILVALLAFAFLALAADRRGAAAFFLVIVLAASLGALFLPLEEWLAADLESRVPFPQTLPERVDGIVVLGGAVEWPVSSARGQLAVDGAAERIMAAKALKQRHPDARLVFTGLFAEAVAADFRREPRPQSLVFGPEMRDVLFLGAARSTYEDALVTLESVSPGPGETWLLVTSALHMPRALGTFQQQGWSITPYPVDYRTTGRARMAWRPQLGETLAALDRVVREIGAVWIYRRTGRMTPTSALQPAAGTANAPRDTRYSPI